MSNNPLDSKRLIKQNCSAGSCFPENTTDVTNTLANIIHTLAPMKEQDKALDNIDAVVGRPEIKNIPRNFLIPAPNDWNIFPKASDDKVREISESIRQYGLLHYITVWEQPDGRYMILGGHTRVACFDYLAQSDKDNAGRWTRIPSLVYKKEQLSETDAHRIVIVSNTDQRGLSSRTVARAYYELYELEKKKSFYGSYIDSMEAAAKQANTSKSQFCRMMGLRKLIRELGDLVGLDAGSVILPTTGYYLSRLSENLQQYIYRNRLYDGMTVKMAEQLKNCCTEEDINKKITSIKKAPKYFKYVCPAKRKKSADESAVCLFFPKKEQTMLLDQLIHVVSQSEAIPQKDKDKILKIVSEAAT